jgi:hypothetical protein
MYRHTWRDQVARHIANFALNRIAKPHYRDLIDGAVRYGFNSAARDLAEGLPAPSHWSHYQEPGAR